MTPLYRSLFTKEFLSYKDILKGDFMSTELSTKAKKAKNEYQKKWSKDHPGKTKQYQATYWERKAQEIEQNN